jgi:hypothetical protein
MKNTKTLRSLKTISIDELEKAYALAQARYGGDRPSLIQIIAEIRDLRERRK